MGVSDDVIGVSDDVIVAGSSDVIVPVVSNRRTWVVELHSWVRARVVEVIDIEITYT